MDILEQLNSMGINVKGIKVNSKVIEKGDLFFCTQGFSVDKHDYIEDAAKKGAVAAITTKDIMSSIPTIKVDDIDESLYDTLEKFYGYVNKSIKMIGVTGTDGKTTTSTIVYEILNQIEKCGYIGTNGALCDMYFEKLENTTPNIDRLYAIFSEFLDNKCKYVSMEASSAALKQNRIGNLLFDVAIFTNLTYDHMNIHKTMDDYILSKKKLFQHIKPDGTSVINIDDCHAIDFIKDINSNIITYGKSPYADIQIKDIKLFDDHTTFDLLYQNKVYPVSTILLGEFNVYNLCAAIGAITSFGYDMDLILNYVSDLKIKNRMEKVELGQDFNVIVDYAHTENGLKSVLGYLNKIKKNKLIVVTGSIGGREHLEREKKGKIVTSLADYVIFTSDDSKSENPNKILSELVENLSADNYEIILNRCSAIKSAINMTDKDDIILIAGRCGEKELNIMGRHYACDDYEEAKNAVLQKKYHINSTHK